MAGQNVVWHSADIWMGRFFIWFVFFNGRDWFINVDAGWFVSCTESGRQQSEYVNVVTERSKKRSFQQMSLPSLYRRSNSSPLATGTVWESVVKYLCQNRFLFNNSCHNSRQMPPHAMRRLLSTFLSCPNTALNAGRRSESSGNGCMGIGCTGNNGCVGNGPERTVACGMV